MYNATTWVDGNIITADKLNNLESGIKNFSSDIVIIDANINERIEQSNFTTDLVEKIQTVLNNHKIPIIREIIDEPIYVNFYFFDGYHINSDGIRGYYFKQRYSTSFNDYKILYIYYTGTMELNAQYYQEYEDHA